MLLRLRNRTRLVWIDSRNARKQRVLRWELIIVHVQSQHLVDMRDLSSADVSHVRR